MPKCIILLRYYEALVFKIDIIIEVRKMEDAHKIIRQSLIEWYPVKSEDDVLLVNSGDSYLGELLEKRCILRSIDEYTDIKAAKDNGQEYDLVIMYDLYAFCLASDIVIEDMIKELLSVKKKKGTLLLALENKLGMKYFAGCQEEQRGGYYSGIEDYCTWDTKIHPLSKKELEDVLTDIGNIKYMFYYPYPDYKYPTIIYSDDCLPKEGELFRNIRNIDRDRYVIFDERRAFDSVIKAGLFPEFANSFLVSIV